MTLAATRRAPAPEGHWLLGHTRAITDDALEFMLRSARLGPVVQLRFAWYPLFLISAPDAIERVLKENQKNYTKQTRPYVAMRDGIGDGMVSSEGAQWLRQRRIAQPAFHRQRIAGFADAMVREAEATVASWSARDGQVVNVDEDVTRLAQRVAGTTLLGAEVEEAEEAHRAFVAAAEQLVKRMNSVLFLPAWVPTPTHLAGKRAVAVLHRIVDGIIARRRADPVPREDLLSMLLHARDEETGETMSDLQLRAEVITMYFAGHETTATALAWTFHLLGRNPEAEAALHAELDRVLEGRPPTLADLERLPYTRAVFDEALRLYPPVWGVSRLVEADDVLDGVRIPKGAIAFVSPWVTQRTAALWPEPTAFRPERFLDPAANAARHRFAYFPFLGGPRQCIGNTFALMEGQLVLATVARALKLRPASARDPRPEPLITIRPKGGMPMIVERRRAG